VTRDWRAFFLRRFGPGILGGMTFGDWMRTLWDRRFAVAPSRWPRALAITAQSLQNSLFARVERRRHGHDVESISVESPLFVLGHWRNGTTHLHNLLATDPRFAFPNTYQSCFPHTFLSTEASRSRFFGFFLPKHRPMDRVEWSVDSPQEDEFALCILSQKSPCMGWIFPRSLGLYDRYLTLRDVDERELDAWRSAFESFLKKLTWKHRRRLVLKSPPHTARIRLLLEMFPGAKFVHIHRDPYRVFQSSQNAFELNFRWQGLQRTRREELDDWILRQYRAMYDSFFEDRERIPKGHYCEVRFEELEASPIVEMRRVYETLGLHEFAEVEPSLRRYQASLSGYQKNSFPELPGGLRDRIAREWTRCFEEWGYPK
jgi:hypothetical protein